MCSLRPWYIADDAAETVMFAVCMSTLSHASCGLRLTLHVRSKNISLPLTMILGLDGMRQWLGLHCQQISHQWTSSLGATLKPWFTHHQLILKRSILPVLLRQHQPSGSNLAFLSMHVSLCCAVGVHTLYIQCIYTLTGLYVCEWYSRTQYRMRLSVPHPPGNTLF
jgi:hypothetical protein